MVDAKILSQVLNDEAQALLQAAQKFKDQDVYDLLQVFQFLSTVGGNLILSGVGKSGLIGMKISSTFSSLGLPSFFLHPTEAMHGDLGRVTKSDALILISKSGTTDELIKLLPFIQIPRDRVIGILGKMDSPLAKLSGIVLDASVDKEACINDLAPTTSTTLTLAIGDALAVLYEKAMNVSREKFAINHPAGLLGKTLSLRIDQLMIKAENCPQVSETSSLQDAILAMTEKPVGMCAVLKDRHLQGIIVEGDIRRAFNKSSDVMKIYVRDVFNHSPETLSPQTLAFEALKKMENPNKVLNVIPVVSDENGSFLGVIRLHDLFKAGFNSSF